MIQSLHIENLKGFELYDLDFTRINLLVGGNNCGKTTVFHAMNLFFWCTNQTADVEATEVTFRKTQVPELGAIPYFNTRDLFHLQRTRSAKKPKRIKVALTTTVAPPLTFSIYPAFSRNLMIDGGDQKITPAQHSALLQLTPVYVPGTIGITVREELYREVAQERMILEGRQNQVLRNLVYRLQKKPEEWKEFVGMVKPLFSLDGLNVPFDDSSDEWLTATYQENECEFDFVSAGSGFLQVINLLSFLFLHTSRVALLDEPDSHMHDDLQRLTFDLLDRLSQKRQIQIIVATHSPTLIDAAGLEHVLLIDRAFERPLQAQDVETLVPILGDRGLALPPAKVMNTLKARRALFVEGKEADFEQFILAAGEIYKPGFSTTTRGMTVFESGGATKQWPFEAIDCFQQLLRVDLKYLYVSDRDFLTDSEIIERAERAKGEKRSLVQLERRHRESYLVAPSVLARLVEKKWRAKHGSDAVPTDCTVESIQAFILSKADQLQETIRSHFIVEHEASLRGNAEHRKEEILKLNEYFRQAYTVPLSQGEIPYKLLDCKQVLKDLRTHFAGQHRLSFSDRDILGELTPSDLPPDLKCLLEEVIGLFASAKPVTSPPVADRTDEPGEPSGSPPTADSAIAKK